MSVRRLLGPKNQFFHSFFEVRIFNRFWNALGRFWEGLGRVLEGFGEGLEGFGEAFRRVWTAPWPYFSLIAHWQFTVRISPGRQATGVFDKAS